MSVVPVIRCTDMARSLAFYTGVLDFRLKYPGQSHEDLVIDIVNDMAELQLSALGGDGMFGSATNIGVMDVDALFKMCVARGLDASKRPDSPVHQGPVDQTWGKREFYVTDPDGNTLRFGQVIED
jgi:catechol 2,3-dioxygenase-like lactoylglutathione lyase family enzyme